MQEGNYLVFKQQLSPIMTRKMQKAITILQMPIIDCIQYLEKEILENPILEESFSNYRAAGSCEPRHLQKPLSQYEYLMNQASLTFSCKNDVKIAQLIIGNLDDNGFFTYPLSQLCKSIRCSEASAQKVLQAIWQFDPPGIAASDLQHCLLLQLEQTKKIKSLAYSIVSKHFSLLISGKIHQLQKELQLPKKIIHRCIVNEILKLSFRPASIFHTTIIEPLIPDVVITKDLNIEVQEKYLPTITISKKYLTLFTNTKNKEEREYIKKKIQNAYWLTQALLYRKKTLTKICEYICKKQKAYFEGSNELVPMSVKEIAAELSLHESTVHRTVSQKYISCHSGIFLIRKLFSREVNHPDISSQLVMEFLQKMIENEDQKKPISDSQICKQLHEQGIQCARRTIGKYRKKLKMPSSSQRKRKYSLKRN